LIFLPLIENHDTVTRVWEVSKPNDRKRDHFPFALTPFVFAGLDPAIHLLAKKMDPRVPFARSVSYAGFKSAKLSAQAEARG
jgi:hypothetical protein